jgi:SAM-dependent methyltransferase
MDNKGYIVNYYKDRMKSAKEEYQILGWESKDAHQKRFEVFINSLNFKNKSILDVGCGVGSFYGYLLENNINCKYFGVDIIEDMINLAKDKYKDVEFKNADILDENYIIKDAYDIIVLSGIFNLKLGNNKEFIRKTIEKLSYKCNEGIIFNLLDTKSKNKEDLYFYINHSSAFELIEDICKDCFKIEFIKGYLDNDYTICLKK